MYLPRLPRTPLIALFALTIAMSSAASADIIVGGSTLNGDFNADTSTTDSRSFAETPNWENIGTGDQAVQATRTTVPNTDGSRNAVMSHNPNKVFGLNTGYSILDGDVFDIGYDWRDASGWNDATDQVQISLFVTADDTIGGTRTNLVQMLSGLSTTDVTYETVDQNGVYTAVTGDVAKILFVEIDTISDDGAGFGRLDDFTLEVTPIPEPSSIAIVGFMFSMVVLRRGR
jgi:hypothetical protein